MDQLSLYNAGDAQNDKLTYNYYQTLQFPSELRSVLASTSSCFGVPAHNFTVVVQSHCSRHCFPAEAGHCFQQTSSEKPTVQYLADKADTSGPTPIQTDFIVTDMWPSQSQAFI